VCHHQHELSSKGDNSLLGALLELFEFVPGRDVGEGLLGAAVFHHRVEDGIRNLLVPALRRVGALPTQ